eukprot:Rmarinus@m.14616
MIIYDREKWGGFNLFFHYVGSALPSQFPYALIPTLFCFLFLYYDVEVPVHSATVYFSGFPFVLGFMLVYRTNLAYRRFMEGRTHCAHLMSRLVDVAIHAKTFVSGRRECVDVFRKEMGRLLYLYFTLCVHRLRGDGDLTFDLEAGLLTRTELKFLQVHSTACFVVMEWITEAWVSAAEGYRDDNGDRRSRSSSFETPSGVSVRLSAPIVANTFRLLSEVQYHFNEARKLRETPFPFPYVQMVALLLMAMLATMPIVLTVYVPDLVFGPALTFLTAWSLLAVNEVAAEIEMPFGPYANDLPLNYFLDEFHADLVGFGLLHPMQYLRTDREEEGPRTVYVPVAADESTSTGFHYVDSEKFVPNFPTKSRSHHSSKRNIRDKDGLAGENMRETRGASTESAGDDECGAQLASRRERTEDTDEHTWTASGEASGEIELTYGLERTRERARDVARELSSGEASDGCDGPRDVDEGKGGGSPLTRGFIGGSPDGNVSRSLERVG